MTTTSQPAAPATAQARAAEPTGPSTRSGTRWSAVRPLLLRLHFYAGVLVAPFLVVAAVTGFLYTLTPQLDRLTYGQELRVAQIGDQLRPLDEQVAAARAAHPEGTIASVTVADDPAATTRVVLDVEGLGEDEQRTVFVDPYTAEVRGALTTWFDSTPLTTWLDDLHRHLHLGETGRLYSETAASWLWVVVLGGLVLWLARRRRARRLRRILLPDLSARGVRRTMGWHGATGLWLAVGLLVLSATGLTWSQYAGARFSALLTAADAPSPELDTGLPGSDAAGGAGHGGGHAGHGSGGSGPAVDPTGWDRTLTAGRASGLDGPVTLTPPAGGAAWSVAQVDNVWPVRRDQVAVDPADGAVTGSLRWDDYPVLAKLSSLGVNAHMGILFGLVNQLVLAALALGLLCMIVWGYRMWWQRRPLRDGREALAGTPPAPGGWRRVPLVLLVPAALVVVAVGWALPVLGITLAAFLVVDLARAGVLRLRRRTAAAG